MLLKILVVIIIIIGGIIIVIGGGPFPPEPDCLVCGGKLVRTLGVILVALGALSFFQVDRITKGGFQNQGKF